MKKLVLLSIVGALLAALAPAKASAHTDAQLHALLGCMVRSPVAQFGDVAWFGLNQQPNLAAVNPSDPATYPTAPLVNWGSTTYLDLAYAPNTPDVWLLGVRNTAVCRKKFKTAPAPARPASAKITAFRLARAR